VSSDGGVVLIKEIDLVFTENYAVNVLLRNGKYVVLNLETNKENALQAQRQLDDIINAYWDKYAK